MGKVCGTGTFFCQLWKLETKSLTEAELQPPRKSLPQQRSGTGTGTGSR